MIRPAETKDIPRLGELLLHVHKVHADGRPDIFIPGGRKYTDEELAEVLADEQRPVFVYANDEGVVAGYAFCIIQETAGSGSVRAEKTLYIDDICIDPDFKRQGIGSALYQHVLNYARQISCRRVTLNVWECNASAKAFYEALGMSPLKTTMEQIL